MTWPSRPAFLPKPKANYTPVVHIDLEICVEMCIDIDIDIDIDRDIDRDIDIDIDIDRDIDIDIPWGSTTIKTIAFVKVCFLLYMSDSSYKIPHTIPQDPITIPLNPSTKQL